MVEIRSSLQKGTTTSRCRCSYHQRLQLAQQTPSTRDDLTVSSTLSAGRSKYATFSSSRSGREEDNEHEHHTTESGSALLAFMDIYANQRVLSP